MNNALMFIGCLFVAVLAALFGVPYLIDWNGYRGVFEEEASRILGREVRVGGKVNVRLLPAPFVRFEKIRIADTFGQGGEPLFRAEDFTMWLSVSPLLQGVLQAHDVELRKPIVRVATDAEGSSNWSNLDINPGQLPFVPSGVKLQSVRIIDGTLIFGKIGAGELLRFEKINGEVGGDAIDGPYKFAGTLSWMGQEREVRVATARPETDGTVRFKTSVRPKSSSNSYVVDGRVTDLKGRPKIAGELTASLAFAAARSAPSGTPPLAAKKDATQQAGPEKFAPTSDVGPGSTAFDLKAKFDGDARALKFTEIALTREDGGAPQLVTGEATSEWGDKVRLDLSLSSKWLDLDRISGSSESAPLVVAQGLLQSLVQSLPSGAETRAKLQLDQVNLGGSNVSDVAIAITRAEGPLELTDLRAGLPGGAIVAVKGVLVDGAEQPGFRGQLDLRGQSLARFMAWGMKDATFTDGRGEVPFSLQGEIAIGDKTIELTQASAELGGVPLKGELKVANEARRKLALVIEGHEIDASQVWAGGLKLDKLRALLLPKSAAADKAGETSDAPRAPAWLDPDSADISIRLRTALLSDGELMLRDVDADMRVEQDRISVPVLKFSTDNGLALELEGEVLELDSQPKGALRGLVTASSPAALDTLMRLFGDGGPDATLGLQLAPLTPARLAVRMGFGERTAMAADFVVDGIAGGGRISASVSLDGGLEGWRKLPVDIAATIETPDARRLVSVVTQNAVASSTPSVAPQRGLVLLKAVGVPEKGLVTQASIGAQELALAYDGRMVLAEDKNGENGAALDGEVRFSARAARDVLAVAGLSLDGVAGAVPMEGIVGLVRKSGAADFAIKRVALGTSLVTGRASVAKRIGSTSQVSVDLEVDRASLPDIANALAKPTAAAGPAHAEVLARSVWSERPFDFAAIEGMQGDVRVRVASLEFDPGLGIADAVIEGTVAPGRITVSKLTGATLGGQSTVSLAIEKAVAGAKVSGTIKISDAWLDLLGSAAQKRTSGARANVSADFAGQGLSPASVVSALRGTGVIEVADLTLKGMAPWTVVATAEAALSGTVASGGDGLVRALRDAIQQGELKFGPRTIPLTIGDGAVKVAAVTVEAKDGRTTVETTLDLSTLEVDAEWKLEPRPADDATAPAGTARKSQIPSISVVYVGKLGQLAILEPRIATAALERELAVRKMELDVDALERLRKSDEERARQESERQKAIDAEAAKAAAAAAEGQANDRPAVEEVPPPPVPGSSAMPADPALATAPTEVRPVPTAVPRQSTRAQSSSDTQRRRSAGEEIMKQLRPF